MVRANDADYKRSGKHLMPITVMFLLGLGIMGLAGCGHFVKWKEEVQLSDGGIIVVDRETIYERGGDEWAHNRSGTKPKENRIRFQYPTDGPGKTIEWRTTKTDPFTWPEIPLILDIESGQPIVFTAVAVNEACKVYLKYVYRGAIWVEETLPEVFEPRVPNLFLGKGVDMRRTVDLQTKLKENANKQYPRTIRQIGPERKACGG